MGAPRSRPDTYSVMKAWIAPAISVVLGACMPPSAHVPPVRECVDPPPTRVISVSSQADTGTSIEIVAVERAGRPLEYSALLIRRASDGDTLLYGLGSSARLFGLEADSITILARHVGFFRRSVALRLRQGARTIVTIPLDQMPSHWCGLGERIVTPTSH